MMKKGTIGSDLDGVLYPWQKLAYDEIRRRYGIKDSFAKFWQKKGIYDSLIQEAILWDLYDHADPDPHMVEVYQAIGQYYPMVYVTHRPSFSTETTRRWLEKYNFPNPENLAVVSGSKARMVKKFNCLAFIEDRISVGLTLMPITKVIIKTQPWNKLEACPFERFPASNPFILLDILKDMGLYPGERIDMATLKQVAA